MRATWLTAAMAVLAWSSSAQAADLTAAAISAWDAYVRSTETRRQREVSDQHRFLTLDYGANATAARAALLRGDLVIDEVTGGTDASGSADSTVHHWRGAVLVPGVSLHQLVEVLRNPHQHGYKPPDVLEWRLIERRGDHERVFLQIQRQEIVTAVFNTEHSVDFTWYSKSRAASRSVATRIAEVADPGTPNAREKPAGNDRGFLWRMNSYWRYEAVADGVLVELESLTLSRSVPGLLRPIARPIIRRVARESLQRTLLSIRDQIGRRR